MGRLAPGCCSLWSGAPPRDDAPDHSMPLARPPMVTFARLGHLNWHCAAAERWAWRSPCAVPRLALECRRRRRGPQVRQERGHADESIPRSASTRPGRSTPQAGRVLADIQPASSRGAEGTAGAEGIATEQACHTLKPLTCTFAPPAGLEPATYGLEVDPRPSGPCC
jgi:hypothetical protein